MEYRSNTDTDSSESKSLARGLLFAVLNGVRYMVYLVLLFLRPIVVGLAGLIVPACMLGGIFWGFVKGWSSTPALALLGVSFALFVLSYLYDSLLLLIAPDDIGLFS